MRDRRSDDCVGWPEMRWIGSHPDPIDAVLDGDVDQEDLLHVAAVVHDVRTAFARTEPLDVRPELAEIIGAHLDTAPRAAALYRSVPGARGADHLVQRCRRKLTSMLSALGAFAGTLAGKVALATAATAASVGGLHATDVVDVPVLPETGRSGHSDRAADAADDDETPDAGTETAAANKAAADAFTTAIGNWTDCVASAAAGQGDEQTRTTGGFDPREDCGERPAPADYGLTDLPEQAAEAARRALDKVPADATAGEPPVPEAPAAHTPGDTAPGTPAPAAPPEGTAPETSAKPDAPAAPAADATPRGDAPDHSPAGRP